MRLLVLLVLLGCDDKTPQPGTGVADSGTPVIETPDDDTGEVEDDPDPDPDPDPDEYAGIQSASTCGECHPQHYAEWRQSMHRYAAISPVFDEMAAKAFRDTAGGNGTFCTGCHTPLGTLAGEPGSTNAAERSELSREGVTCQVCHQAVAHEAPIGNTSLLIDFSAPVQGPFDNPASLVGHDSVKGDLIDTPELCGSCHDVFNFPGLRIEEAYTEYQSSPSKAMGQRCQDCHMGPNPGAVAPRNIGPVAVVEGLNLPDRTLSSHRFVGPDYSLIDGFPYEDDLDASAEAQADMKEQIQTLLTNAVHIADVSLDEGDDGATLNVVVESLTAGHNVPTGFTSERQMWVSIKVVDEGVTLFESGDLDSWGDLRDELSWDVIAGEVDVDESLVNFQSLNLLRIGDIAITVLDVYETIFPFDADFIWRRSLAPLEARSLQYDLPTLNPSARIEIGLHYRNLPPYVLRALQLDELVDRLEVFTLDEVVLEGTE